MRTVSELAELAGITVRTLHHYHQIGLLTPTGRSAAGYRLYDHDDLIRLQQVLSLREMGFALGDIASLLDDPDHDQAATLRSQRASLTEERARLGAMLKAIDTVLDELEGGPPAEEAIMFDGFDHKALEEEARERWGDTDAWRESQRRTAGWTDADRVAEAQAQQAFAIRLAEAFTRGVAAEDPEAIALAEEGRLAIHERFYDCPPEMHAMLGEMYVADERFRRHYDQHAEGLAEWYAAAIRANRDAG